MCNREPRLLVSIFLEVEREKSCRLSVILISVYLRLLYYRNRRLSLTEVTVVELAWIDPDGGAGAEVDAETDHVVQLKV